MSPDRRPVHQLRPVRRLRAAFLLAAVGCLAVPAGAQAFDTGPHSDLTRDALTAEGFSSTATDVAQVENWFVDLYSNASKIPQSGHASIGVGLVGSFLGPRENWPDAVVTAATRLHFDAQLWDVSNVAKAQAEWDRLQRATAQALRSIKSSGGGNKELQLLAVVGIGLHAVQDFYSHSNWIEKQGVRGVDGTDWSKLTVGLTPTWFDVPKATRDTLNVYIGDSTGHKDRVHGGWNADGNKSMVHPVNKDWPGRPGYTDAYTTSYFASRQWVRAIHTALGDEALWNRTIRYADRKSGQRARVPAAHRPRAGRPRHRTHPGQRRGRVPPVIHPTATRPCSTASSARPPRTSSRGTPRCPRVRPPGRSPRP